MLSLYFYLIRIDCQPTVQYFLVNASHTDVCFIIFSYFRKALVKCSVFDSRIFCKSSSELYLSFTLNFVKQWNPPACFMPLVCI